MAEFLLTEADVEEHKEKSRPKRMKIDDSDEDDDEEEDEPTQADKDFINDDEIDEDENPNTSTELEAMERKLEMVENKRKRGRPPLNKKTEDVRKVYISSFKKRTIFIEHLPRKEMKNNLFVFLF